MPFVQLLTHSYQIMRQYAGERRLKHRKKLGVETKICIRTTAEILDTKMNASWTNVKKIGRDSPSVGTRQRATRKWNHSMGFPKPQMALCIGGNAAAIAAHNANKIIPTNWIRSWDARTERQQTRASADAYIECENRMSEKNAVQKRKIRWMRRTEHKLPYKGKPYTIYR